MGGQETKRYATVVPGGGAGPTATPTVQGWTAHMVKNLLIAVGDQYEAAKDFSQSPDRHCLCAAQRKDGLWVVLHFIPQGGAPDKIERSVPHRQVLGLQLAGGRPLYVGLPEEQPRPRVYWGETAGEPFDAIDHKELQWADGEPLYPARRDGWAYVIQGTRRSEPTDEIVPPLQFVAGRPLWRTRFGQEMALFWGTTCARGKPPYDDISQPTFDGKEIVAWATQGVRLYRLCLKVK